MQMMMVMVVVIIYCSHFVGVGVGGGVSSFIVSLLNNTGVESHTLREQYRRFMKRPIKKTTHPQQLGKQKPVIYIARTAKCIQLQDGWY